MLARTLAADHPLSTHAVGCTYIAWFYWWQARYLHDILARMLLAPIFLDSNDLSDLRALFDRGLHRCDAVLLLATKGVLTRPVRCGRFDL